MVAALSFAVSCIVMRKLQGTNPTVGRFEFVHCLQMYKLMIDFFLFPTKAGRILVRYRLQPVHDCDFAFSKVY